MTPEKLKEIEQRYLANGDALDASSYCVLDLIHEVRAAQRERRDGRIKALEAEVEEQSLRESKWAKKFEAALDSYARRLYNVRKCHIVRRRKMQSKYRAEVEALREENRMLNWQKEQLEAQVATLREYVDDVEWFNSALADKDWPTYSIAFIDSKPVGVNMMQFKSEDACGDTLIEAIRSARKGAER